MRWTYLFKIYVAVIVLLLPIAIYVYRFPNPLSDHHPAWGEFGPYLSGVYTPILSFLTLGVLVRQLRLQERASDELSDRYYLDNARSEVNYYIEQIFEGLPKQGFLAGPPTHPLLIQFEQADRETLLTPVMQASAAQLDASLRVLANWSALYGVFSALEHREESFYALLFTSAKQRAVNKLNWHDCVGLDNALFAMSAGRFPKSPQFSEVVK